MNTLKGDAKEGDFFHFLNLLAETDIVLDIGANIGIMSVHLSRKVPQGHVHAFEPIPQNFEILTRITEKFEIKNITLNNCALGDEEKQIEMVLPIVSSVKMQGLSHVVHDSIQEFNEGEIINTDCKILDKLFENTVINAIKIDVENFEYFVLKGGRKLLEKNHPIIYIELWDNENRTKCFELVKQLGYSIKVVISDRLVNYDSIVHNKQNFILTVTQTPQTS